MAELTHQTSSTGSNNIQPNDIAFSQRSQDDILAGHKTITVRDEPESHFKAGDILRVKCFKDDGCFYTIEAVGTSTVTLGTLTGKHARQENMTFGELEHIIAETYPDQTQFCMIDFKCLRL